MKLNNVHTQEYNEYVAHSENIKETLEDMYNYAVFKGDLSTAYDVIGKLMAYKLIERDDDRIQMNNTAYRKAGIEKDHRFTLDYRKDFSYIPKWVYGDINVKSFSLAREGHWGTNPESFNNDPMYIGAAKFALRMAEANTTKKVDNFFEELLKHVDNGAKLLGDVESIKNMCKLGVYRAYTLVIENGSDYKLKDLVFMIFKMEDAGMKVYMFLNNNSFVRHWFPVEASVECIKTNISDMCKDITCVVAGDLGDTAKKQETLTKNSNVLDEAHKEAMKAVDDQKAEREAKKAERAAKKAEREANGESDAPKRTSSKKAKVTLSVNMDKLEELFKENPDDTEVFYMPVPVAAEPKARKTTKAVKVKGNTAEEDIGIDDVEFDLSDIDDYNETEEEYFDDYDEEDVEEDE